MNWAEVDGARSLPAPGMAGRCPACKGEVIAKCGEIISWHWAHKVKDCDPWSEPESEWHRAWKNRFPTQMQEVVIPPHRADVQAPRGIIEFQRSAISASEIRKREAFYGRMAWVVDASEFWLMDSTSEGQSLPDGTAKWLWMRKSWLSSKAPVYFDRGGNELLRVEQINYDGRVTYSTITKRAFIEQWTGLLSHERLLPMWVHPLYSYMRRPEMNPRLPELGSNHAVWGAA